MKSLIQGDDYERMQEVIKTPHRLLMNMKPSLRDKKEVFQVLRTGNIRKIFKQFKDSNQFLDVLKRSGIGISTMNFKTNLTNIIDKFRRLRKLLLSLHFFKGYLKNIKEICKENGREFEKKNYYRI